jgi:hypothetical protein
VQGRGGPFTFRFMGRRPSVLKSLSRRTGQDRAKSLPAYKNPRLHPSKRTADLLARMTLEEKAAQMMCVWQE